MRPMLMKEDVAIKIFSIAFSVSDLELSIAWYENVLGFKLLHRTTLNGDVLGAYLKGGGFTIEMLQIEKGSDTRMIYANSPPFRSIAALTFLVTDLETIVADLENKGVELIFQHHPEINQELKSTLIRDPDGNFISILEINDPQNCTSYY